MSVFKKSTPRNSSALEHLGYLPLPKQLGDNGVLSA